MAPTEILAQQHYNTLQQMSKGTVPQMNAQQQAQSAGPDMGAAGGQAGPAGDNVVDADYEVVDDDK